MEEQIKDRDIQLISVSYDAEGSSSPWTVTDSTILSKIRDAINKMSSFHATNEFFSHDPSPGQVKSCTVTWRESSTNPSAHPILGISVREGEGVIFSSFVNEVHYGPSDDRRLIFDTEVYKRLNKVIHGNIPDSFFNDLPFGLGSHEGLVQVSNEIMGGDPTPGVKKDAKISVLSRGRIEPWVQVPSEGDWWPSSNPWNDILAMFQ